MDLKHPKQIEVEAVTYNKSLWENLHNTRQCEDKMLRNSIALIKEMVDCTEVKTVEWVDTHDMLADALTKKGGNDSWIKELLKSNIIVKKRKENLSREGRKGKLSTCRTSGGVLSSHNAYNIMLYNIYSVSLTLFNPAMFNIHCQLINIPSAINTLLGVNKDGTF